MDVEWIKEAITDGKFKLLHSKFLNDDAVLRQVVDGDPKIFHGLIIRAIESLSMETDDIRKKYDKIILRFIRAAKDVHFGFVGGTTLLIMGVIYNTSYENICQLIEAGSDVNATDDTDLSVLMHAVISCYDINVIKELIKNGADVNYKRSDGRTPLFLLVRTPIGHPVKKVIPILVEAGADILHCIDSGSNILMEIICDCFSGTACRAEEAAELFIKKGGNITVMDNEENTIIHRTWCKNLLDLALRSGVSIEAKNKSGHTALMVAAMCSGTSKVCYLLRSGADPNCTDFQLNTILHLYASRRLYCEKKAKLILYHGGSWNACNIYNQTPLDILLQNV